KTGYGGKIKVMVGIDNGGTVKKVAIISADDETPGLGQNVKTDEFLSRFENVSSASGVDAWTGATISSTAVKGAVNEALELYNQYKD
ncbi:MAG: FMN-binding protein, partial [Acutalibacteraceae bacterium]|nr:FMN-binding protein [Acutalibacteraceae bacterium]